jgi:hypothetical protein
VKSRIASALLAVLAAGATPGVSSAHDPAYTTSFLLERCEFSDTGANPYFVLEPGHQLVLEGLEKDVLVRVTVTVLQDRETVDGVRTRVVEEFETHDGETVEVSPNFFAICEPTNSVVYFGEEVDIYEEGVAVSHAGSWRAGVAGARPGVIMPGMQLLGARYHQEIAPGVALDRAETVGLDRRVDTPAGVFERCLETKETTPLEPNAKERKFYAPDVGLVKDGAVELVSFSR